MQAAAKSRNDVESGAISEKIGSDKAQSESDGDTVNILRQTSVSSFCFQTSDTD